MPPTLLWPQCVRREGVCAPFLDSLSLPSSASSPFPLLSFSVSRPFSLPQTPFVCLFVLLHASPFCFCTTPRNACDTHSPLSLHFPTLLYLPFFFFFLLCFFRALCIFAFVFLCSPLPFFFLCDFFFFLLLARWIRPSSLTPRFCLFLCRSHYSSPLRSLSMPCARLLPFSLPVLCHPSLALKSSLCSASLFSLSLFCPRKLCHRVGSLFRPFYFCFPPL
jgi:hypothetical protein